MNQSLCETCSWMRAVVTPRGSRFLLCQLSQTNSAYAKYPPQPVLRCAGFEQNENSMKDDGRERWHGLLRTWSVDPVQADRTFDDIRRAYSGSGRFYHTLAHVLAVLGTVDKLASFAGNVNAVKLAAWLHDVIYDSKASNNEERSAEYA